MRPSWAADYSEPKRLLPGQQPSSTRGPWSLQAARWDQLAAWSGDVCLLGAKSGNI